MNTKALRIVSYIFFQWIQLLNKFYVAQIFYFIFLNIACFTCMHVNALVCAWCLQRQGQGVRCSGPGVTKMSVSHQVGAGNNWAQGPPALLKQSCRNWQFLGSVASFWVIIGKIYPRHLFMKSSQTWIQKQLWESKLPTFRASVVTYAFGGWVRRIAQFHGYMAVQSILRQSWL